MRFCAGSCIYQVQIQRKKYVLDHVLVDYTAPSRQHDLQSMQQIRTLLISTLPGRSGSLNGNRLCVKLQVCRVPVCDCSRRHPLFDVVNASQKPEFRAMWTWNIATFGYPTTVLALPDRFKWMCTRVFYFWTEWCYLQFCSRSRRGVDDGGNINVSYQFSKSSKEGDCGEQKPPSPPPSCSW